MTEVESGLYGSEDDGDGKSDSSFNDALSRNSIMVAAMRKETERVKVK